MKIISDDEFRAHAGDLLDSGEPVFITHQGEATAVYLPLKPDDMPMELRKKLAYQLAAEMRAHLEAQGVSEEQVLDDFRAARKAGG